MSILTDRIDAMYAAFGDVPRPRKIEGCPCCIGKDEVCTMLSKPLRDLTGGELASYSESAFLTVGEVADYLYFLPRILEVACVEPGRWWPDIEITGRAIGETHPAQWPARRRTALMEVLHAALQEMIDEEDDWRMDALVCAIARMGVETGPFLKQIGGSTAALLAYYERNSQELIKGKLGNAFWDRELPGFGEVVAWFKSPEVERMIAEGYGMADARRSDRLEG